MSHLTCMWDNKSDFFMIIVSIIVYLYSHTAKYKGTELLPPF